MSGPSEIREARRAARALATPMGSLAELLSPGQGLLALLSDSPEDLPLVAFSPFDGLPGGPVEAPGRPVAGQAPSRRPAPAVLPGPAPSPPRSRSIAGAETEPEDHRLQPGEPAASLPVFSLRRPLPAPTQERQERGVAELTGSSAGKRVLTLTDLLSLEPDATWPDEHAAAAGESGGVPQAVVESPAAGRAPEPIGAVLDASGRGGSGRQVGGSTRPGTDDLGVAGRVAPPPTLPDPPLPEAKSARMSLEPLSAASLERAGLAPEAEASPEAPGSSADFSALPRHTTTLAASGEPARLDAGTLADLVNEALVEQARRHGVDLS